MSYLTIAKKFNLDVAKLNRGETIQTSIVVDTPEKLKKILEIPESVESCALARHTFTLADEDPASYEAGLKHFSAYACGATVFDPTIGAEFYLKRFPMKVNVAAGETVTVSSDTLIGPGAPPCFILCENLIFDGGSYTVRTTSFTLWVTGKLTITSRQGTQPYHIAILGSPGGRGADGPNGLPQQQAPNGRNAPVPSPGVCTGAGRGGKGAEGNPGYDGTRGDGGMNGVPSLTANINIARFAAPQTPLVIFGMSGIGGDGGKGGDGGPGQQGGNGGDGCSSGCEGTRGGDGGLGGDGGNGNNGGNGGNGVKGGMLYFNCSPQQQGPNYYSYMSQQAKPGQGGLPGAAGLPGAGGNGGRGGNGSPDGTRANSGTPGAPGVPGSPGVAYGAPPEWVPGNYTPPPESR